MLDLQEAITPSFSLVFKAITTSSSVPGINLNDENPLYWSNFYINKYNYNYYNKQ